MRVRGQGQRSEAGIVDIGMCKVWGLGFLVDRPDKKYVPANTRTHRFRYDVHLNSSNDDPKLTQFDIYPEDNDRIENGLTDKEVRDLIYRNGKVPVWIDVAVHKSDRRITTFKLLCAGRYSDDENEY